MQNMRGKHQGKVGNRGTKKKGGVRQGAHKVIHKVKGLKGGGLGVLRQEKKRVQH